MKQDKRITQILEQIRRFKYSNFDTLIAVSDKGDDLDAIAAAMNSLGRSLKAKQSASIYTRLNEMLEILLEYSVMDFSRRIQLSEEGDDLDAVGAGLNALVEELQEYIEKLAQINHEQVMLNNELDSFSYSVSHDLRAPLRSIFGYSKILEEDHFSKLDQEGQHAINVILRNSKKMGRLIDDLLTFSRLGKKSISVKKIDMDKLVRNLVDDILQGEEGNKIKMQVNKLPEAYGDSVFLKQVWFNLLSNAIKYATNKAEVIIAVNGFKNDDDTVYSVKDNGVGFDMQYYNKLFGVFQRLHSEEEFEGTGVGLAIAQKIISKHNGEIWAESKLNEGAQFFFSLPNQISEQ